MVVIGYEESSQLDVEPARYFVLVRKREKRACRSCEDLGVVSAPLPPRIIEKCLASDRIGLRWTNCLLSMQKLAARR
jgi:transposase